MRYINDNAIIMSAISIPLYFSLAVTCFYYAFKFWEVVQGRAEGGGLYGMPKLVFFVVLGCSAVLDLPTYLACSGKGGPDECLWNHESYAFVWSCHLVATCGYLYAVITPSILWSDIIQQKDGNFWNSSSQLDFTKIFFRVAFVLYCCIMFTNILGVVMFSKSSDESAYSNSSALGAINNCLTPIILVVVTAGCFWSGVKLRQYVKDVQLGSAIQVRILMKLNFTMFIICASYVLRAILVMSLYNQVPDQYDSAFKRVKSYPPWIILTQWIPFVLCSFCLVNEMRFHGVGKGVNSDSNKQGTNTTNSSSPRHSSRGGLTGDSDLTHNPLRDNSTAFLERVMTGSVDSIISDIARSDASSRSRSQFNSSQSHNKLNLLMGELERGEGGIVNIFDSRSSRSISADNFFNNENHYNSHDGLTLSSSPLESKIDHFFTASAMMNDMHAPPSARNST